MASHGPDRAAGDGSGRRGALRPARRLLPLLLLGAVVAAPRARAEPLPVGDATLVYQIRSSHTDDPAFAPQTWTEQDVGLFLAQEVPNYGVIRAETHWFDAVGESGDVGWTQLALTDLELPAFAASLAFGDAGIDARLLPRRLLILTDPGFDLEGARLALRGPTTEVALFGGRAVDRVGSLSTGVNRLDQDLVGLTLRGTTGPVAWSTLYVHGDGGGPGAGSRVPARTDTMGVGVEVPIAGPLALLGEVRYATRPNAEGAAGRSNGLSYAVGPLIERRGLRFEATAFSLDPAYLPIQGSDPIADRRGLYTGLSWDPWGAFGLFGSALRSRNNLADDPSLLTIETTQVMLGAHAFLPLRWPIGLLVRGESTTLESTGAGPSALDSRTRALYGEASQVIGNWRPVARARWSRLDDAASDQASDTVDVTAELWWQVTRRARLWSALGWNDLSGTSGVTDQTTVLARLGGEQRVTANLFLRGEAEVVQTDHAGTRTVRTGAIASVGYRHRYFDAYLDLRRSWTTAETTDGIAGETTTTRTDDGLYLRVTVPMRWGRPTPPPLGRQAAADDDGWGTIEGRVFVDDDGDGVLDPGEPGVGGLSVILDGLPGTVVPTDEEGRFAYPRVASGLHSVRVIVRRLPAEFDLVSPQLVEVTIARRATAHVSFAAQRLGRIAGRVTRLQVDAGGEPRRLADAGSIPLYLRRGDDIWQTFTDDEGYYAFDMVRGGEYELFVDPAALPPPVAVEPGSRTVRLGAGEVVEGVDFTIRQPSRRDIRNGGGTHGSRAAPPAAAPAVLAGDARPAQTRDCVGDAPEPGMVGVFYFATDSSDLRELERLRPALSRWAEWLRRDPAREVLIEGHTDRRADDPYNFGLAARRAYAVYRALAEAGAPEARLQLVPEGPDLLCDPADTPEAHAANRRVLVTVSVAGR
ncbi:MAG TPA: OmpA family protein [Thermodesulfobacteriota bacterium]